MNHLPSLIKETIDFYEWNTNLKILNKEYFTKVKIVSPPAQPNLHFLMWDQPEQNSFVTARKILYLKKSVNSMWVNWEIKSFIKPKGGTCRPQRYFYSSGCSNPTGYSWDIKQRL